MQTDKNILKFELKTGRIYNGEQVLKIYVKIKEIDEFEFSYAEMLVVDNSRHLTDYFGNVFISSNPEEYGFNSKVKQIALEMYDSDKGKQLCNSEITAIFGEL